MTTAESGVKKSHNVIGELKSSREPVEIYKGKLHFIPFVNTLKMERNNNLVFPASERKRYKKLVKEKGSYSGIREILSSQVKKVL